MKKSFQPITLAALCAGLSTLSAYGQTAVTSGRALNRSGTSFATPNLIVIGTEVISPVAQPAQVPNGALLFSGAGQNRGLGMGQQGTGTAIGQQGQTLIGPPPVFQPPVLVPPATAPVIPPPAPVTPAPAPVLTPPTPLLNTPSPALNPQSLQPAITPQSITPSIPPQQPPALAPVAPAQGRGLGIGQQGSGTSIGQQGTTLIGPQQNESIPGQQGTTTVNPPPAAPRANQTGFESLSGFSVVPLQTTAIIGPPGSFSAVSASSLGQFIPQGIVIGPGLRPASASLGTASIVSGFAASSRPSAQAASRTAVSSARH